MSKEQRISDPRTNERIRVPEVRLVGPSGEQVGVVTIDVALRLAAEADLDLVEVAPNSKPPVAKIMDYGKFKYEAAQKAKEHPADRIELASRLAGLLRSRLNRPADGDRVIDELVKAQPNYQSLLARGRYRALYDPASAEADFRNALQLKSDDPDAYIELARLALQKAAKDSSQFVAARKILEEGLTKTKDTIGIYRTLAELGQVSNQLDQAIAVSNAGYNVSRAIGPALGGVAIAASSIRLPFWDWTNPRLPALITTNWVTVLDFDTGQPTRIRNPFLNYEYVVSVRGGRAEDWGEGL